MSEGENTGRIEKAVLLSEYLASAPGQELSVSQLASEVVTFL